MNERSITVALRYCGGCNPRYDRVALAAKLAECCPFAVFSVTDRAADAALVVCGCSACCADRSDLSGRLGMLTLSTPEDLPSAKAELERMAAHSGHPLP